MKKLSDVKALGYDHQLNVYRGNVVREIRTKYFSQESIKFTNRDLDTYDLEDKIKKDPRTGTEYFMDYLRNYNIIFYTFSKKTILTPQPLRVMLFFQYLNLFCFFNSLFFFDDLIEFRSRPENQYNFLITITYEYMKFALSHLLVNWMMLLIKLLLRPRSALYEKFNKLLWSIDIAVIEAGQ